MALESSDLNDGQILQQTRQITDERGHIQFAFKLPSGRDLKSEFMRKEDARTGIKKWLEVVKEQAIADSNAERLERAAKSRRGSMDLERKPGDDQPLFRAGGARGAIDPETGAEKPLPKVPFSDSPAMQAAEKIMQEAVPTGTIPKKDYSTNSPDVEPLEFAKQQRDIYAKQVEGLLAAQRKLRQWTIIVENLEEFE